MLFWHTATVAPHSRSRFSAVSNIIPASQVLSETTTAGFGQVFPERASAAQQLLPFEISRNANGSSSQPSWEGGSFTTWMRPAPS